MDWKSVYFITVELNGKFSHVVAEAFHTYKDACDYCAKLAHSVRFNDGEYHCTTTAGQYTYRVHATTMYVAEAEKVA